MAQRPRVGGIPFTLSDRLRQGIICSIDLAANLSLRPIENVKSQAHACFFGPVPGTSSGSLGIRSIARNQPAGAASDGAPECCADHH